jgi:CHAT domain-containing protein
LKDKATAYTALAENGQDTEGYTKALQLTQQIVELADDIRADYFSDDAKLTLATDAKPALEKAISVCQKLYQKTHDRQYLEKAFDFIEYSRSMVLYENARLSTQLPPELKAENEDLKKKEAALIAKNNVEDLQNYLRLKRQFREKIKIQNRNQLASIATFQADALKDDQTAFVEYFVGDSSIFAFTILKNDIFLHEIRKPKDLEQKIETLRAGITTTKVERNATAFFQQAADLYALLGQPCLDSIPASVTKSIFALDGSLSYVPFELLPKTPPSVLQTDFRKIDYLLKHYDISYAYSANMLLQQKQPKKNNANRLFLGFAPEYKERDTALVINAKDNKLYASIEDNTRAVLLREKAYALPGAKKELEALGNLLNGKTYYSEDASERVFKNKASQYRILHLAMHSIPDESDPMQSKLLFTLTDKDTTEDNDLTAAELHTMQLNADLAVLSACNTGYGKLSKGEGVMSIARAFTYAGVPATVTSLWVASETSTPDIMVDFYKNLKAGMTKDAALRQAKLTYIENAPESVAANPYYWAVFVPMGNMAAMDMTDGYPLDAFSFITTGRDSMWGIGLGVLAILGLIYWYWRRKNTGTN